MKITDSFPIALRALKSNPLRSALTMLGVIIGVFIVITTVSMGQGAKNFVHEQMSSWGVGANTLALYGSEESDGGMGMMAAMTKSSITYQDIQAIRNKVPGISYVSPAIWGGAEVRYGRETFQTSFLIGTSDDFAKLVGNLVVRGRFITPLDVAYRKRVVFLGQSVIKELFGVFPPIGEELKINGVSYKVIGVMKKMTAALGMDFNEMVIIPITSAEDLLKTSEIMETWAGVDDASNIPRVKKDINKLLLKRHGKEDFQIKVATDLLKTIDQTMAMITLGISAIAAISLLVGSIGIMNIMLVSVTERIKEIGIRKSVGARNIDIFLQFVVESIMVSSIGGVLGILLGAVVLYIIGRVINLAMLPSLGAVMAAFIVSTLVGIVSGVYPAMRAAKLDPVEALRG